MSACLTLEFDHKTVMDSLRVYRGLGEKVDDKNQVKLLISKETSNRLVNLL